MGNTPAAVAVAAVLAFVFPDVILAVAAAVKAKTFQVGKIADFIRRPGQDPRRDRVRLRSQH